MDLKHAIIFMMAVTAIFGASARLQKRSGNSEDSEKAKELKTPNHSAFIALFKC